MKELGLVLNNLLDGIKVRQGQRARCKEAALHQCTSFWVIGINSFQVLNSIAEVKNLAQRLEREEGITEEDQRDGGEEDRRKVASGNGQGSRGECSHLSLEGIKGWEKIRHRAVGWRNMPSMMAAELWANFGVKLSRELDTDRDKTEVNKAS